MIQVQNIQKKGISPARHICNGNATELDNWTLKLNVECGNIRRHNYTYAYLHLKKTNKNLASYM